MEKEIFDNDETFCNFCGLSCNLLSENDDPPVSPIMTKSGLINAEVYGNYFSTPGNGEGALDDSTFYKFSLCEFCLDHLFQKFKIPPIVTSDGETEPFVSANERINKDEWRKMKREFDENVKKHDNARINNSNNTDDWNHIFHICNEAGINASVLQKLVCDHIVSTNTDTY